MTGNKTKRHFEEERKDDKRKTAKMKGKKTFKNSKIERNHYLHCSDS